MSIAISVVLKPSKMLQKFISYFIFLLVITAIYCAFYSNTFKPVGFICAALCLLASCSLFFYQLRLRKKFWHIFIDKNCHFRCELSSSKDMQTTQFKLMKSPFFILKSGSTLWNKVLFLHLYQKKSNKLIKIMVTSDALSELEFRHFSIAIRWIAIHGQTEFI